MQADLLLEKAADMHLSAKTQTVLLQQAQTTRTEVAQLQDHLNKTYMEPFSLSVHSKCSYQ